MQPIDDTAHPGVSCPRLPTTHTGVHAMEFPSADWLVPIGAIVLIGLIFIAKKLLAYLLSAVVIMGSLLVAPDWLARQNNPAAERLVAWREGIMPSPPWLQWLQGKG